MKFTHLLKDIEEIINLAKDTELNAVAIDIKDDDGYVGYETKIKEVKEIGARF
jgi:hypothetical protein